MCKIDLAKIKFDILSTNNVYKCIAKYKDTEVCKCQISANKALWTISSWYTHKDFLNQGIGTKTLKFLVAFLYNKFGTPQSIEYIWNGTNYYVYEWIESKFDAISTCPIAVQKTQCEDDWSSHIYNLNVKKVIEYFIAK